MRAFLNVFLACALFLTAACSSAEQLAAAEREVERFHKAFDEGQFGEIYDKAADAFRKGATRQEFIAFMETVQRKLGKVEEAKRGNSNLNYSAGGTLVSLAYATTFANGKGTEQFGFAVSGKKAVLVGYNLNSKDLLLR
ncbi:DUF4019 domain-containing protein [Reyranella sp.]|jgi:hypothetical protein|uniref:DUF4019 domain-containing protein n=1 Tax=Reyranella sp. TaxID=1929291 RepID=UPI004035AC32